MGKKNSKQLLLYLSKIINKSNLKLINELSFKQKTEFIKKLNVLKPIIENGKEVRNSLRKDSILTRKINFIPPNNDLNSRIIEILENIQSGQSPLNNTSQIVLKYNSKDFSISRNFAGEIIQYSLNYNSKRRFLLEALLKRKRYIKTDELCSILRSPSPNAIAKMVQTFNQYCRNKLKTDDIPIIEGKKGLGYRINPKILINKY